MARSIQETRDHYAAEALAASAAALKSMVRRFIDCAELCQDELEPETYALIGEADALLRSLGD